MKAFKTVLAIVGMSMMSFSKAFASSEATEAAINTNVTYNSGILVLVFAGFLALVVVAQTIPALINLYGMIKGAKEAFSSKEATTKVH
ncbi:MAG: hypothetical protein ACMV0F_02750 [Trichlorobacter sp.]